jgi:hypothetical protein
MVKELSCNHVDSTSEFHGNYWVARVYASQILNFRMPECSTGKYSIPKFSCRLQVLCKSIPENQSVAATTDLSPKYPIGTHKMQTQHREK